jgi:hypothetical protein
VAWLSSSRAFGQGLKNLRR